jgi:ABC-type transporter Mla subunit MlaD
VNIFGRKDDDKKEEAEKKKIGETIQNLSDQVGDLKRKANETEKEHEARVAALQKQLDEARRQATNAASAAADKSQDALLDAQRQIRELEARVATMANQKASSEKDIFDTIAANTPTAAAPVAAAPAVLGAVGGFTIGSVVYVKRAGGKNLRRRSGPGLKTEVLGAYEPGTALTLKAGPVPADDYEWWHVSSVDGTEGYVAGSELSTDPQ